MLDEAEIAWIIQSGGELLGEAEPLVELTDGKQTGIAAEASVTGFDEDGAVREKIEEERRRAL
jgi:hypothetical protein